MALRFSIHFQPFAPKKMGFWVKKGKILKISQFSIRLTYEALEAILCFPKAWRMFVSREDIQAMILSTERPMCHVGEPRYGPPKFWRLEKMSGSEPIFLGTLAVHISAPRRDTQPVQYSKSLSGGPLCSQTSFSIIMPVEMQYFRLFLKPCCVYYHQ